MQNVQKICILYPIKTPSRSTTTSRLIFELCIDVSCAQYGNMPARITILTVRFKEKVSLEHYC